MVWLFTPQFCFLYFISSPCWALTLVLNYGRQEDLCFSIGKGVFNLWEISSFDQAEKYKQLPSVSPKIIYYYRKINAYTFHKISKPSSCNSKFFLNSHYSCTSLLAQSSIFWCWSNHFYTWLITKKCLADVILFCFITLSIEFISDSRPSIFVNIFCFIFLALVWFVGITSIWNKRKKYYMVHR